MGESNAEIVLNVEKTYSGEWVKIIIKDQIESRMWSREPSIHDADVSDVNGKKKGEMGSKCPG